MRQLARPRVGQHADFLLLFMEAIVPARHHARGIPKCRMLGDVLDALTIDVDLAAVLNALQELRTGVGVGRVCVLLGRDSQIVHVVHSSILAGWAACRCGALIRKGTPSLSEGENYALKGSD